MSKRARWAASGWRETTAIDTRALAPTVGQTTSSATSNYFSDFSSNQTTL